MLQQIEFKQGQHRSTYCFVTLISSTPKFHWLTTSNLVIDTSRSPQNNCFSLTIGNFHRRPVFSLYFNSIIMCILLLLWNRNDRRWREGSLARGRSGPQVFREPGISMIKAETGEQSVASEADTFHACLVSRRCVASAVSRF